MAVTQTGAIYKAFSFDNVSSRDFGVYITSEAAYNAPERDVEMISIPGRNGAFALDKGRFENIEVKYPAGIFADNEADFAQAVSDLRNYLCSKKGYFRLTDEYNPDEFRMAVYKSGLEVLPVQSKAGEFEIIFDCKPQRWLTSGETAITVSSGDTITNPTRFESSPMLEVEGYGNINMNGFEISLQYTALGHILLLDRKAYLATTSQKTVNFKFEANKVSAGDPLYFGILGDNTSYCQNTAYFSVKSGYKFNLTGTNSTTGNMPVDRTFAQYYGPSGGVTDGLYLGIYPSQLDFTVGTSSAYSYQFNRTGTLENVSTSEKYNFEIQYNLSFAYDGTDTITLAASQSVVTNGADAVVLGKDGKTFRYGINRLEADSSALALGHPTYIDCDLGAAYMVQNGTVVSLNRYIDLGSDLPVLSPSNNTITFDNTVTDLKVIPRWWKI